MGDVCLRRGFDLLTKILGSLQSTYIVVRMFRQTRHSKYLITKQSGSKTKPCLKRLLLGLLCQKLIKLICLKTEFSGCKCIWLKPDPEALTVDAFTLDWASYKFYAFSLFSILSM